MTEAAIVRSIVAWLKRIKPTALTVKLHGNAYQRAGLPDIMWLSSTGAIFLEVKTKQGTVSPLQAHTIRQLRGLNYPVFVVRSKQEAQEALRPYV